jgi:hypothetical protein
MENEQPSYYAIIPANVRYADIPAQAKLLYGEITALCNREGYCWATNKYFANLYNVSEFTVSRWISKLRDKNLLNVDITPAQKGQEVLRKLSIPIDEKSKRGIDENSKDNNTSINITNNITNNNSVRQKNYNLDYARKLVEGKDTQEFEDKYSISQDIVIDIAEELVNYVASTGKRYKDYKATMHNWIKRKLGNKKANTRQSPELLVLSGKVIN